MKTTPEAHHFVFLGDRARKAQSGLDRFRAAAVKMGAAKPGGRNLGQKLEGLGALRRRESTDRQAFGLPRQGRAHLRMGMAEARDRDTGKEIEENIAVNVGQGCAFAMIEGEAGEQRDTLASGGEDLLLAFKDCSGPGPGYRRPDIGGGTRG